MAIGGKRTGLPTLRKLARQTCRILYVFDPTIRRLFPDNAPLLAALEAANLACDELVKQIDGVLDEGT